MEDLAKSLLSASPLAVIALLSYVIYLLVWGKGNLPGLSQQSTTIAENHLHELPEMMETLKRIEMALKTMNDNIIYIRARVNGHDR